MKSGILSSAGRFGVVGLGLVAMGTIPARAIVKFKPGKELKVKVATLLPELKK